MSEIMNNAKPAMCFPKECLVVDARIATLVEQIGGDLVEENKRLRDALKNIKVHAVTDWDKVVLLHRIALIERTAKEALKER